MSPDLAAHNPDELWRDIVHVMLEDIARIQTFVGDLDAPAFAHDEMRVFAVCYAFVRLGEATAKLPESLKAAHPSVPWSKVRHFRNFMVHVYLDVDPAHLHSTTRQDLPALAAQLRHILGAPPRV